MMRINKQMNAKAARSYFTSRAEYYLGDQQELPGIWGGKGAVRLALAGEVAKDDFDAICRNRTPGGGKLTSRDVKGRIVGHDFNFHVPKSVSLALLVHGETAILTVFRAALAATLEEMETAMQTRVRKSGQMEDRTTGEMLYSQHTHLTARPVDGVPDPHLHAHCFIFNATFDGVENQWKASKINDIWRDAPYYQAVFLSRLASEVAGLGYRIEPTAKGWEIAGLSGLVPKFSLRTAQIEGLADQRNITDPAVKDNLGAETRQRKCKDLGMSKLRQLWLGRLDDGERQALAASAALPGPPPPVIGVDRAIEAAITQGFVKGHGLVPEKRLVATALMLGLGSLTADDIRRRLPAHGIVFRDYDGQRFCARLDQRQADQRQHWAFELPPGLAERQTDAARHRFLTGYFAESPDDHHLGPATHRQGRGR